MRNREENQKGKKIGERSGLPDEAEEDRHGKLFVFVSF